RRSSRRSTARRASRSSPSKSRTPGRRTSAPTTTRRGSSAAATSGAGRSCSVTRRETGSYSSRSIAPAACRARGSPAWWGGGKEPYPTLESCKVTYLDGDGKLGESFEAMRRHLRSSRARRALIGAINDPSALGALRAMQEAGRVDTCAIMGHNASPEGRAELRQPGTRLVGSVAYFPEKYGAEIVAVALDILNRRAVPPAVFVKHQLVTPENVDHIYPNDQLIFA